jgi:DNA-binding transcriptional regulator YiaG
MTHTNRSKSSAGRNPKPAEILAARQKAGLTQTEAGALLFTTCRVWQQWEAGDRRMHPSFWELFNIKTGR